MYGWFSALWARKCFTPIARSSFSFQTRNVVLRLIRERSACLQRGHQRRKSAFVREIFGTHCQRAPGQALSELSVTDKLLYSDLRCIGIVVGHHECSILICGRRAQERRVGAAMN